MEEHELLTTPKRKLANMQLTRLGNVLFVWNMLALAAMLLCQIFPYVFSVVASVGAFLFAGILIIIAMCLFFLPLLNEGYASAITGAGDVIENADGLMFITSAWVATVPLTIGLACASAACLFFAGRKRHMGKFIASAVSVVAAIVILIINLVGGGAV